MPLCVITSITPASGFLPVVTISPRCSGNYLNPPSQSGPPPLSALSVSPVLPHVHLGQAHLFPAIFVFGAESDHPAKGGQYLSRTDLARSRACDSIPGLSFYTTMWPEVLLPLTACVSCVTGRRVILALHLSDVQSET